MKIVKIDTENNINNIDIKYDTDIKISLKSIDTNNLELLYEWNFESNIIECYGCLESDYNIKNQHTLPSFGIPSSDIICEKSDECNIFGNIYMVCKKNGKYYDYYDYDYGMLYFNINNDDNIIDNNDDNDNNDNNDIIDTDDDNCKNELIKSKYIIKKNIQTDLLEYDNNIY